MSRRTQAVLTAGVLALSSAMPTVAIAAEPDHEQEGAATPEQIAVEAPASDPGVDPGGNATDLPFEAAPAPAAPVAPENAGPVEQEPVTNEDAPVADAGDGSGMAAPSAPGAEPTPAAAAPSAPPAAPETPVTPPSADPAEPQLAPDAPDPTEPPSPPTTEAPADTPTVETPAESKPVAGARAHEHRRDATPKPAPAQAPTPALAPLQQAPGETPTAQAAPVAVQVAHQSSPADASTTTREPAGPRDRLHVVEPGESLWSIARDMLGDGASAARIAREVNRLWELNSERIRTGDRNLLMVGTRLALR